MLDIRVSNMKPMMKGITIIGLYIPGEGFFKVGQLIYSRDFSVTSEISEIILDHENGHMSLIPVYLVYVKIIETGEEVLYKKVPSTLCTIEYSIIGE